jgi:hydroxymethylbilane synthase
VAELLRQQDAVDILAACLADAAAADAAASPNAAPGGPASPAGA